MNKEEILAEVKKKYPDKRILIDIDYDGIGFLKRDRYQQEAVVNAIKVLLKVTNYPVCRTCKGEGKEEVVFISKKRNSHLEFISQEHSLCWVFCETCNGFGRLLE